jgi:FkbM family methyltransferase
MVHRISALGGYTMEAPEGDWISAALATGRPYEAAVLDLCRALVEDGLFVDAGAHIGNHTIFMATAGAQVIAFEPNPTTRGFLQRNVQANGLSEQVQIIAKGLWSESSVASIVDGEPGNSGLATIRPGSGEIGLVSLDDLDLDPDLLKIDVEGMEMDVLRGAPRTLSRSRPSIIVEANDGPIAVEQFLRPFGYRRLGSSFAASPTFLFVAREDHRVRARPHVRRQIWTQRAKAVWGSVLRIPGARQLRGLLR